MPSSFALPSSSQSTPASLFDQLRTREEGAWDRLVRWVGPLVLYWCKRAGLSAEDRMDVFQEVFSRVAGGIDRFEPRPDGSFRGWLYRITQNQIADLARQRLRQLEGAAAGGSDAYQHLLNQARQEDPPTPLPDEERQLLLRQTLELVRSAVEPQTWQAFCRTTLEGLNASQAAAELAMTPAAVRRAKARVLARLRQHLEGWLT
jgi:RNA polymerase sigma-70 factor (ECF subfamily)